MGCIFGGALDDKVRGPHPMACCFSVRQAGDRLWGRLRELEGGKHQNL